MQKDERKKKQPRIDVSLSLLQLAQVTTKATASFNGNKSGYVQALIDRDRQSTMDRYKDVIRLMVQVKSIAKSLGFVAEEKLSGTEDQSVDLVIDRLKLGLELRTRFDSVSNELRTTLRPEYASGGRLGDSRSQSSSSTIAS